MRIGCTPYIFQVLLRDSEWIPGEGDSSGVLLISVVLRIPNGKYFKLGENQLKSISSSAKTSLIGNTSSDLIQRGKGAGEFAARALVSSLCARVIATEQQRRKLTRLA